MVSDRRDGHAGGSTGGLPDTIASWLSEPGADVDANRGPPSTCASCGTGEAIQWLRMITDWEDHLCHAHDVRSVDGVLLIPLCNRCRAWAEIIEIAEMALPHLAEPQAEQIRQERRRFIDTLNPNLVRGIRVSEDLDSFSE